jgi:feruloyl esterase
MRYVLPLSSAALAIAAFASTPAQAAPSETCDAASIQAMAPPGAIVSSAAREWGGTCRIMGYVTTQNPGPNQVLFSMLLPDNFNGRFLYLGVGGAAGALPPMPASLLAKGYALAGSDGGSGAKTGADFSFQNDPAKALDYSWRGVHVSAQATQRIALAYYKRPQMWRYISGCSGGGNMGRTNAQRFGREDFDGFLVGAVAWPASLAMPNFFRIEAYLQNHPDGWMSPEVTKKAAAAILAAYDSADGVTDGIIADQRNIPDFDIGVLRKAGLTPAQIDTFNVIRNPYKFPRGGLRGDGYQAGYSINDVSAWSAFLLGRTPPPWPSTAAQSPASLTASGVPFAFIMVDSKARAYAPGVDFWHVTDFDKLLPIATNGGKDVPPGDAMDSSKIESSGAKMILYHGSNDQAASYLDTLAAYDVLTKRYPASANWLRLFVVPGMLHCRGGDGPTDVDEQLLESLVTWVENGNAPDSVTANRRSPDKGIERRFLICAEPKRTRLNAAGLDPNDARNWSCQDPERSGVK